MTEKQITVAIIQNRGRFHLKAAFHLGEEILALVGPSGAGKTTLLCCLAGLERPSQGEVVLNGRLLFSSASGVNLPARQRRVGVVFQDYVLFPHLTVAQNAAYGMKGAGQGSGALDLDGVLAMLGISHLARCYPRQISGGEQQRTALARALLAGPELLLLDEPLSALDEETRALLRERLKELQRRLRLPVIVVTHSREEALFLGDRVAQLERGRLFEGAGTLAG